MRYNEPIDDLLGEERQKEQIPLDPGVATLRWSNEIEPRKHIFDEEFMKRNRLLIGECSKTLPMGNIRDKKTVKLFRLRRMNIIMELDAGLYALAEQTMLANLADVQTSRAVEGFNPQLMVTQIRKFEDRTKKEQKKGLFSSIIKGEKEEETRKQIPEEYQMEEY